MPAIPAIAHAGRGLKRFGLAGCLLTAGLLGAAVVSPSSSEAAPAQVSASVPEGQDSGKLSPATAPSSDAPMPESPRPTTGIGFGWG